MPPIPKIALINMPFSTANRPVLGISLLQAGLRRKGMECDIHYFNLRFAGRVGLKDFTAVAYSMIEESLAGEWVFRDEIFGKPTGLAQHYLEEIPLKKFSRFFNFELVMSLLKLKEAAHGFIEDCLTAKDWGSYAVVGFTSTFQQNLASLALAGRIKEKYPNVLIAFGGSNCEGEMGIELHRRFPFVDVVCSGEGDLNFPEFLERVSKGEPASGIQLDGIINRRGGETVIPKNIVCPLEKLDELPIPSYDDHFDQLREYGLLESVETVVPLETSRGCWWGAKQHCTFCGLNGSTMSYRSKSPQRALDEIEELGRKYGKVFHVADNIMDMKYLDTVIPELIERDAGYNFYFEVKVNLKKEHLRKLALAGMVHLQPGIENLSTSVLKLMRKGCTFLQNVQFLKWTRQFEIEGIWNFLYGFPGEEKDAYRDVARHVPALVHLRPPEVCCKVRFDRFSPYFTESERFELRDRHTHAAYAYVYPFEEETLSKLAYYFEYDFDGKQEIDEYAKPAIDLITAWQKGGGTAVLDAHVLPGELSIIDTRFGEKREYRLTGFERELYLHCDESRSFGSITRKFPEATTNALQTALDRFLANRLMVQEGNSYLSLAVLRGEAMPKVELATQELRVLG
jgi:ribosomal peptide maturation radical SAM protein 1